MATNHLWTSIGVASLQHEANPPQDLDELVSRSDVVVRGRVVQVREGKEYPSSQGPSTRTLNATVEVAEMLKGDAPARFEIQLLPVLGFDVATFQSQVPTIDGIYYLQRLRADPSGTDLGCTSTPLCVLSAGDSDGVAAPRDEFGGAAWFGSERPRSLDEVAARSRGV